MNDTETILKNVMERLFPETGLRGEVYSILDRYGGASWQPEGARVKLAILKLASGNTDQVRYYTVQACRDYRNVLASAETPNQMANPYIRKHDPDRYLELGKEDEEQYRDWIREVLGKEG